jgi:hypothetical protein
MARHLDRPTTPIDDLQMPRTNVRVLHGEEELTEALARAAEGAKRLHERLQARAARDTWMAEHTGQALGWLRFVRAKSEDRATLVVAAPADRPQRRQSSPAA